jgi:transcriptional regulator with XRE-family HTH domain
MLLPVLPSADLLTAIIAENLVRQEARLDGDAILFLRKSMHLTGTALAHILGVHRVEVSRWENNKVDIDPYYDFKLRLEVIEHVLPDQKRQEAREEVMLILHRAYKHDSAVTETPIDVPQEETACASI